MYPGTDAQARELFLNGGTGIDGKAYPKVDMSLWDQATMCGTCHVGGWTYEKDRNGLRLPMKTAMDMGAMMQGQPYVNPFTSTVWETYTQAGAQTSFTTLAPWLYPQYLGNNPANGPMGPAQGVMYGWGQAMTMPNPNGGPDYTVAAGQLMMPNVKEMDCLFCHLQGFDNVMSSVMTQAGSLNAAPAAGAGLFDMTPGSPTYMGYNGQNGNVAFTNVSSAQGNYAMVSFSDGFISKIKAKPLSNNCMQCHATGTLKDMPEMFGVTGTSSGFLSSAPMIYDPANGVGPLGKRMTAYDINAMWMPSGNSTQIDFTNYQNNMMPGLNYLSAMGWNPLSSSNPLDPNGYLGGGNAAGTGPLYYYNDTMASGQDQNVQKRSVPVFARAEWFKRGDAWQPGQDVHGSFGCAGCHFTGDSTHKNQCDPGRGYDMASTVQDGVPAISKKRVVKGYNPDGTPIIASGADIAAAVLKSDTRNTVKRCEFCHVTGKDYYGNDIETFGATDPTNVHQSHGLVGSGAIAVQIADKTDIHNIGPAGYGGQGISEVTNFTTENTKLGKGNHLDVMDCTVCHTQKISMAVRSLDATSGMRYPSVEGTDPNQGMMGLFEDPAPDSFNEGAVSQYNGMYAGINGMFGYTGGEAPGTPGATGSQMEGQPGPGYQNMIPAGTHVVGSKLKEWKPLHMWQKLGNMEAPLSFGNGAASQMNFRRKIYLANSITALIWNNVDPLIDANGDTVKGGVLDENKPSLAGYKDIFDDGPVSKNNTQGYGEPIYDPWIMRDLKEGMNFGPSALSVISIGFGDPMVPGSGSAYNADGTFSTANYWKYASVWSGAVMFTEPNQINDYKASRGASWNNTELAVAGAPFMVTHGVKRVASYAKGKSCADCHAPGAGFFNGDFTMLGTAIPADRTFNPTAQLSATQNASGDYVRNPGLPGFESASNLMARPLEPFRIKADIGDLRTFFEGFNKLGQPRTVEFQEDDGTYTWTVPIKRSSVLYPHEEGGAKIYYKISDTDADGDPIAGAVPMDGQEYADYMETLAMPANAVIATINGTTSTGGTSKIEITAGANVDLVATTTGNGADTTYTWTINDVFTDDPARPGYVLPRTLSGAAPAATTFTKTGIFTVTLTAVNPATGVSTQDSQTVYVKPVSMDGTGVFNLDVTGPFPTAAPAETELFLTWTTPPTYNKAVIVWGDGSSTTTATADLSGSVNHAYKRLKYYSDAKGTTNTPTVYNYKTKFYFYNGAKLVAKQEKTITLAPTSDLVLKERLVRSAVSSNLTAINYNLKKGAEVYLVFSLYNKGPGANSGITVTMPALPSQLSVLSSVATKGSYTGSGNWTGISLEKGQTAYLTLRVKLNDTAVVGAPYTVPAAAIGASSLGDSVTNAKTATKLLNITAR